MTGRGPEPSDDTERATQLHIVNVVRGWFEDRADYMPLLQMLLTPPNPSPPPHGKSHSQAWQAARIAWNARCRAWVVEQGRIPGLEVRKEDQRAYEAATGDVWALIEEGL